MLYLFSPRATSLINSSASADHTRLTISQVIRR